MSPLVVAVNSLIAKPLGEQIYDIILTRILASKYGPGERLYPEQIRAELRVSITPVRDAIQRLKQAGFVEVKAREGVYVAAFDITRAREIFEVRIALEELAARNAATRTPDHEIEKLRVIYSQADDELTRTDDDQTLERIDMLIHELTSRYSDNCFLRDMLTNVHQQMAWVRTVAGRGARRYRQSFQEHKVILEALARRKPDEAAHAMREHLEMTKANVLSFLAASDMKQSEAQALRRTRS